MTASLSPSRHFDTALDVGRPPNIKTLFPHSRALIVSGKYIDRALIRKSGAMTIAANGRNHFVLAGALQAAQRAGAAIIIEIARSEGGTGAYCAVNFWNIARHVDALCNQYGITVPVAIHADHFGIKSPGDIAPAKVEIPSLFDAGITSIAIDASHMPDADNLLANLVLAPFVPRWAGLETEVGEIKGKLGLSTVEEARFLIEGLNAHSIFPDWIALNNGTSHGIEASGSGIQIELTQDIHKALEPFRVSGAQHGTSGNSSEKLKSIAAGTRTTKANVATALQMISWGVAVNDYGNAILDDEGRFIKQRGEGVSQSTWEAMLAHAEKEGLTGGNFKKLNLPFENRLLAQPEKIRNRMIDGVESFVHTLLTEVFNASDTAEMVIEEILNNNSHDPGPKGVQTAPPEEWTEEKIRERGALIQSDKGPEGDFDD